MPLGAKSLLWQISIPLGGGGGWGGYRKKVCLERRYPKFALVKFLWESGKAYNTQGDKHVWKSCKKFSNNVSPTSDLVHMYIFSFELYPTFQNNVWKNNILFKFLLCDLWKKTSFKMFLILLEDAAVWQSFFRNIYYRVKTSLALWVWGAEAQKVWTFQMAKFNAQKLSRPSA